MRTSSSSTKSLRGVSSRRSAAAASKEVCASAVAPVDITSATSHICNFSTHQEDNPSSESSPHQFRPRPPLHQAIPPVAQHTSAATDVPLTIVAAQMSTRINTSAQAKHAQLRSLEMPPCSSVLDGHRRVGGGWRHKDLLGLLEGSEEDAAADGNPGDARLPAPQERGHALLAVHLDRAVPHVVVHARRAAALRHQPRLEHVQRRRREPCSHRQPRQHDWGRL